jgi:UPF0716 family protein affecting phage T7 exclusion
MARIGCLILLLLIGALCLEVYVYLCVARWLHDYGGPLMVIFALSIVGVVVVQRSLAKLPQAAMTGGAGRVMVRAIGGMLLAFPGLASDALGLLLVLPGPNHLLGKLGDKIVASLMKRSMQRMFGGKGGAMGPGFPFPGPFPGMKPDDRRQFPPKTYDTTAEKD